MASPTEPVRVQVVIDCAEPHELVRFWAAALGLDVEDNSPLVEQLLAAGRVTEAETTMLDGRRQFADVAACRDPGRRLPRVFLQRVPESKTVKNRVHLDLQVGPDRNDAEVQRLTDLGATVAWVTADRGPLTTTMRDPEGNEFCVS
jgi:Glyoxalase-like domain